MWRRRHRRPTMMIPRRAHRIVAFAFAVALVYLLFPHLYRTGDWIRQTNPWSGQTAIEQDFEPTDTELACLNGLPIPGHDGAVGNETDAIPNVVHFIYGLQNPLDKPNAGHFDFLCYLAVRSAIVSLRPDAVQLHYTYLSEPASRDPKADPLTNPWIRRLAKNITLVHHPPSGSMNQYAHQSDTMRLDILHKQGGIYFDIDAFALKSFDHVRHTPRPFDIVLGAEGGNRWGLCNAVIVARANSSFVGRWRESYHDKGSNETDLRREWNYHSVLLPKEMAAEHPDEVCALAPDAFFWPTWTWRHVDWMHTQLSKDEARRVQGDIIKFGGSLYRNQLAYHAWNQMAWDRYLRHLTPGIVRTVDTRFNLLMRRMLEDDL